MRSRIFYVAKINIHGNIFSQDLNKLIHEEIPRVIRDADTIKINSWNWSFTDITTNVSDGQSYFTGNLTKSKKKKYKAKIGSETYQKQSEDEMAETAFFLYLPDKEILIHESTSEINKKNFIQVFTQLLSTNHVIGKVIINHIPIRNDIRQEIKSIEKVTELNISLIHPNPGKSEYNLYNKLIFENQLKTLDIDMKNQDGIHVLDEDSQEFTQNIESALTLVEAGYGSIGVKGHDTKVVQGKRKQRIEKIPRKYDTSKSIQNKKITDTDPEITTKKLLDFVKKFF